MTNKGEAPPRMESIATREEEYLDALDWMLHCDKKGRELYEEFYGRASEYALASAMNHVERDIAQIEGINAESLSLAVKKHSSVDAEYVAVEKLSQIIPEKLEEGDLVLALGAGDINSRMDKVIYEFKKNRAGN